MMTEAKKSSRKTHLGWFAVVLATCGVSFYGGFEFGQWESVGKGEYQVRCTRILDGDTIEITGMLSDEPTKLRVVGIDTFETRVSKKLREQADTFGLTVERAHELGLYAKKTAERNLLDQDITIRFSADHIEYDSFGRLLAYVFVKDVDFGKFLLENGLAYPRTEDHVRDKYYEWPMMQAQSAKKGIFSGS